jgi:hypothetical protein
MHTSTSVQSLSVKSMEPVSEHIQSTTDFVAWLYPHAPKGTLRCDPAARVDLAAGETSRDAKLPVPITVVNNCR